MRLTSSPRSFGIATRLFCIAAALFVDAHCGAQDLGDALGEEQLLGKREPSIAVNPTDPDNVVCIAYTEYQVSTDGGATWSKPFPQTQPPGTIIGGETSLTFDAQGRLFFAFPGFILGRADIYMTQVDPRTGALIDGPFQVSQLPTVTNRTSWIAADHFSNSPFANRLYVTWGTVNINVYTIYVSYSTDQGHTWSPATQLSSPADGIAAYTHVNVGSNGNAYVSYHAQPGNVGSGSTSIPDGISGKVVLCRSTNGGVTFDQRTEPFPPGTADVIGNSQLASITLPQMTFSVNGSSRSRVLLDTRVPGSLYVVACDDLDNIHGFGDEYNIYCVHSSDFGVTWSPIVRVDHGPGTTPALFPAAAIDEATGCIGVLWYDNRLGGVNANGHYLLDVYYAQSSDFGLSFSADQKVNDFPFDPDLGATGSPTTFIGINIGLALARGKMHAAWTGNFADAFQCKYESGPTNCGSPPPNNACGSAVFAQAGTTVFSTFGATTDGPDEPSLCTSNGYTQIGNDIWYRYVATCAGVVRFSLCGSDFDSKMAVYASACPQGPNTAVGCNDNFCGSAAEVALVNVSPTIYRIRIGGFNGATGTGTLTISCTACPADINHTGTVNIDDLVLIVTSWGAISGAADINHDNIVNIDDLVAVITAWGPCP